MSLSLDPADPRCADVVARAHRSFSPQLAKTEKERRARGALRASVLKEMVHAEGGHGAFPGFGPGDVGVTAGPALPFAERDATIVGEKFVRVALWFLRDKQFVEATHSVTTHVVHPERVTDVEALVRRGTRYEIADGAVITIATPADEPRTHLILFELWGRLKLFTSVMPVLER